MKPICFALLILAATTALAQQSSFTTGDELRENCRFAVSDSDADHITTRAGICVGFIDGFRQFEEMIDMAKGIKDTNSNARLICIPSGVTNRQSIKVVVKYLDQHPERLHEFAGILVMEALQDAFPCASTQAK